MNSSLIFEPFDVHAMFANSVFCVLMNFPSDITLKTFINNYTATLGSTCQACLSLQSADTENDEKPQAFIIVGNTPASRKVFYYMLMIRLPVRMFLSKNSEPIDEKIAANSIRLDIETDEEVREFVKSLCSASVEMVANTSSVLHTQHEPNPFDRKKFSPKSWRTTKMH